MGCSDGLETSFKTPKTDDETHVWWQSHPSRTSPSEVTKNGRGRAWFGLKAWSDELETKNKQNAFLPFPLYEHGFRTKQLKLPGQKRDIHDFPL